jgi:predicted glycosyltransferase involved in capsule biosynthesis
MPALTQKITLIIPLRLTAGTHEGELRLRRLCATVPRDLYDILISDYGTEGRYAGPIRALAATGIEVASHPSPGRLFSIGHARDFGVQMARQRVVLFNDIDFFGTPDMYRRIHAEVLRRNIAENVLDFFCVPVLFLTEEGTGSWFRTMEEGKSFLEHTDVDRLEDAAALIQSTAFGSSAMVINRHHYLSLGGHDPKFSGHGAEDYDLLHRLAALAPMGPRSNDYYTDYRTNSVRKYWGFRPFFALYGLEPFARGLWLVHLWHPRRKEKGYFRPGQNTRLLRRLMLRFDRRGGQPMPLADLTGGIKMLVFIGDASDQVLMRPLLARAAAYEVKKARVLPDPEKIRIMAKDAGWVVIGPGVAADMQKIENVAAALRDLMLLRLEATTPAGTYRLKIVDPKVSAGGGFDSEISPEPILTSTGRLVALRWPPIVIPCLGEVGSPPPPPPLDVRSPLFASFGPDFAEPGRHGAPQRRKKSHWTTRLWRRVTGY